MLLKCNFLKSDFRPSRISFQEHEIKNEGDQCTDASSDEENELIKRLKIKQAEKRAKGKPIKQFENGTIDDWKQPESLNKLAELHLCEFMRSMLKPVTILIE